MNALCQVCWNLPNGPWEQIENGKILQKDWPTSTGIRQVVSRDLTCSSSELRHTKFYKMNVKVICIDGIINTMLTFKLFCKDFMDILWLDALIKLQYFPDTCISGHIVRKRILPTVTPISWDNKPKHACITDSDIHLMRE